MLDYKQQKFKRKCEQLARRINQEALIPVVDIHYKEFLHNVYYEMGNCYCDNEAERSLICSEIEICRYKNRVQVRMILLADLITKQQEKVINKILCTNWQYKKLENSRIEIIFNRNPHKM